MSGSRPTLPVGHAPARARGHAGRRATVLAAAAVAALAACSDDLYVPSPVEESRELGARSDSSATWEPTGEYPVTLALEVPPQVRGGDLTQVRMRIHNGSQRPISVGFRMGREESFQVLVAKPGGTARDSVVWSSLSIVAEASTTTTLTDPVRPGRDTVLTSIWSGTDDTGHALPPGRYRIRASVTAALFTRQRLWSAWQPVTVVR